MWRSTAARVAIVRNARAAVHAERRKSSFRLFRWTPNRAGVGTPGHLRCVRTCKSAHPYSRRGPRMARPPPRQPPTERRRREAPCVSDAAAVGRGCERRRRHECRRRLVTGVVLGRLTIRCWNASGAGVVTPCKWHLTVKYRLSRRSVQNGRARCARRVHTWSASVRNAARLPSLGSMAIDVRGWSSCSALCPGFGACARPTRPTLHEAACDRTCWPSRFDAGPWPVAECVTGVK